MSRTELGRYEALLEAKQAEISAGLVRREGIAVEKAADALDEVQLASERDLAIRNLQRESELSRSICSALVRIKDGSYGVCLHCGGEIKATRLDAVPWAKYCIRCQEDADRQEFDADAAEGLAELQFHAA
jgi:DnaK suppressor protein